jgi:hypothetical protein
VSAEPLPLSPQSRPRRTGTDQRRERAPLALVPPAARARRAPFVVLLLVLLAGGLVGLLLLNTASAQDAFRLHSLQSQEAALAQQQQAYTSTADGLDDPARLAARAAALGLVPGGVPIFLRPGQPLPKGAIRLGDMVYVPGAVPVIPVTPVVTPAAAAAKKPVAKKPAATKPATAKPATAKPATTKPVVKSPVGKVPATGVPVTRRPVTSTPVTTRTAAGQPPAARTPVAAKPVTGKPAATTSVPRAAVKPGTPVAGAAGATTPATGGG